MSWEIAVRPAAQDDITNAADWYENERRGLGTAFVGAVRAAIASLAENPHRFAIRNRRRQARWFYTHRFPYRIVYLPLSATVIIVAVLLAARHDREWRKRLASD
ncbi:MAG: type II toxin-antitoxin system RelE/ParE family toxin [Opitutaceae bacterium]|nr:type II toxin-antitoxin system RelE/ParE family toxin [Opitutaceae bacterium]